MALPIVERPLCGTCSVLSLPSHGIFHIQTMHRLSNEACRVHAHCHIFHRYQLGICRSIAFTSTEGNGRIGRISSLLATRV